MAGARVNVRSLSLQNFHRYRDLDLDLPDGCSAIVGPNGAGKSSLLEAVDVALFGARSLADHVTHGETSMSVTLTFEHRGSLYRVRRAWKNGKTTLDVERCDAGEHVPEVLRLESDWAPLTRENAKATQAFLEHLLGLSQDTMHASSLLMQGDGDAFTAATPARRKELLFDALGLDVWGDLQQRARDEARTLDRELAGVQATIERLEAEVAGRPGLEAQLADARQAETFAQAALQGAEQALAQVAERYQAVRDQDARRQAAAAELQAAQAEVVRLEQLVRAAGDAAEQIAAARQELDGLGTPDFADLRAREVDLQAIVNAYGEAVLARGDAIRRRDQLEREVADLHRRAQEKYSDCKRIDERLAALDEAGPGEEHCELCKQPLGEAARVATIAELERQRPLLLAESDHLTEQAESVELPEVPEQPEPAPSDELARVRQAVEVATETHSRRARLEERIVQLQTTVDAAPAPLEAEVARELAAAKQAALDELEPADVEAVELEGREARAVVEAHRSAHSQAREQLAGLNTKLEYLQQHEAGLTLEREEAAEKLARLDLLKIADKAYGPGGIPALILENAAIPQIETEANRIIGRLGRSYRFELRTQRELKSGDGVREALDIIVQDDEGERAYETFSGGEQTRIQLALRIALARLIATRRAAEVRLLAIDEPDGLDAEGFAQLAEVLEELAGAGEFAKVLVVSHHPELRHAFESVIEVQGGGETGTPSRLAQTTETVTA